MKYVLNFPNITAAKQASNDEYKRRVPDATTELAWPIGKIGDQIVCIVPEGTPNAIDTEEVIGQAEQFSLPPKSRESLAYDIDAAVAAITTRCAPFLEEYKTREAQAREFAAANYTGPVPQQVAAFATPAGLSAQVATDTIIGQADNLRTASDLLGVQRMRKYEVLRAATDTEARAAHANVMATIAAIGAQIG